MDSISRYHRQMLLAGIGEEGQRRLRESHALVVGCGALGSVIIDSLARAGVGTLTIIDRDVVELTNLQRQILYDEADVKNGAPKAIAAKEKVARVNSEITVHAHVDDFNHRNADSFLGAARGAKPVDIILDGLDNFETRYLLNDMAVMRGLPYIYGGAVATTGVSMAILPHDATRQVESMSSVTWAAQQATPCLRCVFPEAPPPGISPTCDTAGVLGSVVMVIAAHQVTQAIKLLTGNIDALDRSLLSADVWSNETRRFDVSGVREASHCPCCVRGNFDFFNNTAGSAAISLCGRNAVQITPARQAGDAAIDLRELAVKLAPHGSFIHNEFLLRGEIAGETNGKGDRIELTVFSNGRAIIKGVTQPDLARSIYAKYIGA
jgi:molybdopterin/thiamine biosynthesis adenylyltransferase